ncbi:MAG TPA: hypothetical protein VGD05_10510 [Pyrinomonadaceae bacterium]
MSWTSENDGAYVAQSVLAFLKQQVDEGTSFRPDGTKNAFYIQRLQG